MPNRGGNRACGRKSLVEAITAFLEQYHVSGRTEILASLGRVIDQAGPEAIEFLGRQLVVTGTDWCYYASDPLARRLHHVFAGHVLQDDLVILGAEYLDVVADKPLVIFANHVSFCDAHVLDFSLQKIGGRGLCDRLTVVAGPKVYSNIKRRFWSLCFGTVKTPQNSTRSTDEAVMSSREVAMAAHRSLRVAQERLDLGDALLVFAEGTRSRSGRMQQLLPGVARYLRSPNTWVLPVGIAGTERLLPIGEDSLNCVSITLRIGRPIQAGILNEFAHGDRRMLMDSVGCAIGELLPHEYRGYYNADVHHDEHARDLSRKVFR